MTAQPANIMAAATGDDQVGGLILSFVPDSGRRGGNALAERGQGIRRDALRAILRSARF